MGLPVEGPIDPQILAEQLARWRALSPQDRARIIGGLHEAGMLYLKQSPLLREYFDEQERINKQAFKEFLASQMRKQSEVDACTDTPSP